MHLITESQVRAALTLPDAIANGVGIGLEDVAIAADLCQRLHGEV